MRFSLNRRLVLAAAAGALIGTAAPALAASFNCAKAKAADEKAICHSSVLSDLDTQMATLFGVRMQIPMLMGARGAARDEQHNWLVQRGACGGNTACLTQSYQQRIATLKQTIADAMQDYCIRIGICG